MKYSLRAENSADALAETNLPDNFAAERWAKEWVARNAKQDKYVLEGEENGFAELLFKTNAGQWYLTPRHAAPRAR